LEDFVEKWLAMGHPLLKADHSPRQVERRIVIRREPGTKVGRQPGFSTESWKARRKWTWHGNGLATSELTTYTDTQM